MIKLMLRFSVKMETFRTSRTLTNHDSANLSSIDTVGREIYVTKCEPQKASAPL